MRQKWPLPVKRIFAQFLQDRLNPGRVLGILRVAAVGFELEQVHHHDRTIVGKRKKGFHLFRRRKQRVDRGGRHRLRLLRAGRARVRSKRRPAGGHADSRQEAPSAGIGREHSHAAVSTSMRADARSREQRAEVFPLNFPVAVDVPARRGRRAASLLSVNGLRRERKSPANRLHCKAGSTAVERGPQRGQEDVPADEALAQSSSSPPAHTRLPPW